MDKKEAFNRQQVIDLKKQRRDLFIQIKDLEDTIKNRDHTIGFYKYKLQILSKIISSGTLEGYN